MSEYPSPTGFAPTMNNESPQVSRKLVLIVDDNHLHQYSLGKHLEQSGFEVIHAGTGAQTLRQVADRRPDAILLDIHLPDCIGFDICQILKTNPDSSQIPVIFHSATHETQWAKSIAEDVGAISFLSYPIDVDHLLSVLRGAISRAEAKRRDIV